MAPKPQQPRRFTWNQAGGAWREPSLGAESGCVAPELQTPRRFTWNRAGGAWREPSLGTRFNLSPGAWHLDAVTSLRAHSFHVEQSAIARDSYRRRIPEPEIADRQERPRFAPACGSDPRSSEFQNLGKPAGSPLVSVAELWLWVMLSTGRKQSLQFFQPGRFRLDGIWMGCC